jgi:hypothetical protein
MACITHYLSVINKLSTACILAPPDRLGPEMHAFSREFLPNRLLRRIHKGDMLISKLAEMES